MPHPHVPGAQARDSAIVLHSIAPPSEIPSGYVGPIRLAATGRLVWWTGRVAIGLRHQPPGHAEPDEPAPRGEQALTLN